MSSDGKSKTIPPHINFILGGSAGMTATLFVQPLDLIKNRMQLSGAGGATKEYRNSFHAFQVVIRNEGVLGLYNGISAGLLRQATYTTTRLGVYTNLFSMFTSESGTPPNFIAKLGIGMTAGCVGAFVGNPAEVALVRMTADGRLPPAERRNYANVFDALIKIAKNEGILRWWRGSIPTMGRAMVVNAAQLGSYSQAKELLMSTGYFSDNLNLQFWSSMIAGLITSIASLPLDICKTRIQNMKPGADGKMPYSGTLDVLGKTIRAEGPTALWKGFTPYYARIGPHTVLTLVFLEQFTLAYRLFVLK